MKLSIIIPAYHAELYIGRCLNKLIGQIDENAEIIVVDDGSMDSTLQICRGYEKEHENIRVIHQTNMGVGSARNKGILNSKGEWITFIDADDIAVDHYYKIISETIEQADEDVILFEQFETISEADQIHTVTADVNMVNTQVRSYSKLDQDLFIRSNLLPCPMIPGHHFNARSVCAKVFKRDFLDYNQLFFDEGVPVGEDQIFMLRVYSCYERMKCVCVPIYYYVYNEQSVTNRYKPEYEYAIEAYKNAFHPWLTKHPEYVPYYMNCRLGDIMFYLKYDIFHKNNKSSIRAKKRRMKALISENEYPEFYRIVKKEKLLKINKLGSRVVYWLAIHDCYYILKAIFCLRYGKE